MKHPIITLLAAATVASLAPGCGFDDLSVGTSSHNGRYLNGRYLNGRYLNGTSAFVAAAYPNAGTYEGVELFGTYLKGERLTDVGVSATVLQGKSEGSWISGTDFEGATMAALDTSGNVIKLHIDKIFPDPSGSGLWFYGITAVTAAGKEPLCVDYDGNPVAAIPVAGIWDHHEGHPGDGGKIPFSTNDGITFGCQHVGATAKCVELGYWPWLDANHELAHESCVRMIRADYCGDGRSWTHNGTLIDIEDEIPEQLFETYDPTIKQKLWVFEATWGPNGASCIENFRYDDYNPDLDTTLHDEVKLGQCPNLPMAIDEGDARRFLNKYPVGERAGENLCDWTPPKCNPKVQSCPYDYGADYFKFTTVNAKGPGAW